MFVSSLPSIVIFPFPADSMQVASLKALQNIKYESLIAMTMIVIITNIIINHHHQSSIVIIIIINHHHHRAAPCMVFLHSWVSNIAMIVVAKIMVILILYHLIYMIIIPILLVDMVMIIFFHLAWSSPSLG